MHPLHNADTYWNAFTTLMVLGHEDVFDLLMTQAETKILEQIINGYEEITIIDEKIMLATAAELHTRRPEFKHMRILSA